MSVRLLVVSEYRSLTLQWIANSPNIIPYQYAQTVLQVTVPTTLHQAHTHTYWGERSEPHTCGENGKLSIYIYMVRTYSVYAFCPICARCNIPHCTLNHCWLKRQDYRNAEQWESTQQGLENGEEREALLVRPRLIIDGVLHDSAANGECSVYRAISL